MKFLNLVHISYDLPENDVPTYDLTKDLPKYLNRQKVAKLPEVSELQLVRHYTALSKKTSVLSLDHIRLGHVR